jgi:acyl-CoA thioesterase-1
MKTYRILVLFVVLPALSLSGCEKKQADAPQAKEPAYEGIIVAVGDSLTAGFGLSEKDAYPARLQQKLLSGGFRYKVVNAGISGETSSGTLSRINWVLKLKPDVVILETGANDGFRGIPPDLIEKNLDEAVRILKEHKVVVVLAGMRMVGNLGEEYAGAFENVYKKVAEKQGVILIPFFLESVAGDPKLNQSDSIHPTAEGQEIVANTVYPYALEAIKRSKAR